MEHHTPHESHDPAVHLQQPPRHELAYWLDPRTRDIMGPRAGSALRTMAQNFGARRGAAGASIGLGTALGLGALTNLLTATSVPLPALWLGLAATALCVLGRYFWRRIKSSPPPARYLNPGRASTSLAGGWILGSFMAIVMCLLAHLVLQDQLDSTARGIIAYAGYQLAVGTSMLSAFMLPGYFSHHARRDLHRLIAGDPRIRTELEVLSRSWVDPVGTRSFGPL